MHRSALPLIFAGALAAPIALATPTTAAPVSVAVTCSGGGPLTASPNSFSAGIGDVITVTNRSDSTIVVGTTTATGNGTAVPINASNTFTVTSGAGGQLVFNPQGGFCTGSAVNFTATGGATGGGGSSSSESSSNPSPVIQQFGKPASGSCDAAQPELLNRSGVASGGWSESWAQWVNGGNGGSVCTRTLVYSNSLGKWTVE